ncbi:unnamed protein product [Trichobilharzia regenti]|nr:unnamed protein product [Trichobilharzia regenti]
MSSFDLHNPSLQDVSLDVFKLSNVNSGVAIGAAAGPFFLTGSNSEMVINMASSNGTVTNNGSLLGSYDKTVSLFFSPHFICSLFTWLSVINFVCLLITVPCEYYVVLMVVVVENSFSTF